MNGPRSTRWPDAWDQDVVATSWECMCQGKHEVLQYKQPQHANWHAEARGVASLTTEACWLTCGHRGSDLHATKPWIRHVDDVVSACIQTWSCNLTCGARSAAAHATRCVRTHGQLPHGLNLIGFFSLLIPTTPTSFQHTQTCSKQLKNVTENKRERKFSFDHLRTF